MLLIQIVLVLFFAIALFKVYGRYRARELSGAGALLWMMFWTGAAVVALLPETTVSVAHAVGIGRGSDLVVYVALALVFFLLFQIMVRLERMDRHITALTRAAALRDQNPTVPDK